MNERADYSSPEQAAYYNYYYYEHSERLKAVQRPPPDDLHHPSTSGATMAANGYPLQNDDAQHYATTTASSQSPPAKPAANSSSSAAAAAAHQRTYQACIPCRQRKVRCDLGSVDNPHDPPCLRCRRESKECYFSATRRKKKSEAGDPATSEAGDEAAYEIRANRKRLRVSATPQVEAKDEEAYYEEPPRTPGGSLGRTQPLRRPTAPNPTQYGEEDVKASDKTAAILQHAEIHGGHDALNVLYKAAMSGRNDSNTSSGVRPAFDGFTSSNLPAATSPIMEKVGNMSYTNGPLGVFERDGTWKTKVSQPGNKNGLLDTPFVDADAYNTALSAWGRFKFVRAGWFTAKEGIDYIVYFYKHLSPLTLVTIPDFRHPATHKKLLEQEPMLAVTMLLIASRHMKLEGPGSQSRPYAIHQTLWKYLSGMIDRVVWGQEQFGGGFCGAGAQAGCDINPLSRKGLRTLGSVESMVLLTEWHPRAMHFPPDEDDDDLMTPDQPLGTAPLGSDGVPKGIGGHRMDAWLEPCWRSDRMCWMLLGMAMSLAMEIGVFDSSEWQRHAQSPDGGPPSAEELTAYDKRRNNVRDLLLVYVTQTSGRLGLTSMLPGNYSKPEDSERHKNVITGQQTSVQDVTFHFWLRMARMLRDGNTQIFANKNFTRDLIRNGNYKAVLEKLQKPLLEWRRDFDDCKMIPKYMRSILEIEYEYCRAYLNALSLQAVAERCANDQPSPGSIVDPPLEMARSASSNGVQAISPATLSKWLGGDRHYMQTVADAARNVLKVVVDDLFPDEYLRHAPVRTYFRIISVAIMLLKTFSLGAPESDVTDSLKLMERTVDALRTCIVDDVHVASRFADLLDQMAQNLKPRLVRISADGRSGRNRRANHFEHSGQQPNPVDATSRSFRGQQQDQQASAGALPNQQQWAYNDNMLRNSTNMPNGNGNGMYGISNDSYDLMGGDTHFSVMPPPGFNTRSPNSVNTVGGANFEAFSSFNDNQDWLTLPLDPILNMSGGDVNQTMYGPEINGQDMLELLFTQGNATDGQHGFPSAFQ